MPEEGLEDRSVPSAAAPGRDPAASLLVARGITKRYGAVSALSGVDLSVAPGEVVALAGENGSGKSTLSKVLSGGVRPDAGTVAIDGREVAFGRPRDALDAGVALVTQELTAVPDMSVAENVLLAYLRPGARVRRRQLAERAAALLETVGLSVHPLAPFASLRQGDRELAEVAKALASSPRLLILDEATTRLPDPEHLFALVERLRDAGMSTIFITHRLREIRRLADRAVVLRDGEVVGGLARSEITDERLSSMMVGRELGEFFSKPEVVPKEVALQVDGLVALRSGPPVSLSVRRGEVVGLAGLVGAGRSELLEAIAGARPRSSGSVRVGGRELAPGSPAAALRAGVSLLPEDRRSQGLVVGSTVRENVGLSSLRALARTDRRAEGRRAAEAVRRLRIRCAGVEAEVGTLSGGNQQKVVLARCLAHEPSVLLLDEPTRGIDVGAKEEIYRIIAELVEAGMAVLLASSDLLELLALCDRILVLHEGALVGELGRDEATEDEIALLSAGGAKVQHAGRTGVQRAGGAEVHGVA